jgi:hypothetical protein
LLTEANLAKFDTATYIQDDDKMTEFSAGSEESEICPFDNIFDFKLISIDYYDTPIL